MNGRVKGGFVKIMDGSGKADRNLFEWRILNAGEIDMAALDWSQCPAVESVPGKLSGAWVFRGTRMPVETVFLNLEAGMSVEEITEVFDVTADEVRAVLQFAVASLATRPLVAA
ncbi:DUF433 domain-containing protein [Granulicella rosea]|nr:DUF433 domain-containing protein [Granulicella rosea]